MNTSKGQGISPKNQKGINLMKKSTMNAIANYIKNVPELAEEYAELSAEIQKDIEKAEANRALYAAAYDVVMANLTDALTTCGDLFAKIENDLPEGFTKSKLQYALAHYWTDEIIKVQDGRNPNQYRRKG